MTFKTTVQFIREFDSKDWPEGGTFEDWFSSSHFDDLILSMFPRSLSMIFIDFRYLKLNLQKLLNSILELWR